MLIADDIIRLKLWFWKLFPGKGLNEEQAIFNYRLGRARRTIENSYGILATRWRIIRRSIKAKPELVDSIIKSFQCQHNYPVLTESAHYTLSGFIDSEGGSGKSSSWRLAVGF